MYYFPGFKTKGNNFNEITRLLQGIDGSARKPALVQDTNYMVKKSYHVAPYLGAFGVYLMLQ